MLDIEGVPGLGPYGFIEFDCFSGTPQRDPVARCFGRIINLNDAGHFVSRVRPLERMGAISATIRTLNQRGSGLVPSGANRDDAPVVSWRRKPFHGGPVFGENVSGPASRVSHGRGAVGEIC